MNAEPSVADPTPPGDASQPKDPAAPTAETQALVQRELRAQLAAVTGGLAPDVYATAWTDWYLNLSKQPTTQLQLMQQAIDKVMDNWNFALRALSGQPAAPAAEDPRFASAQWPSPAAAWWKPDRPRIFLPPTRRCWKPRAPNPAPTWCAA